MIQRTNIVISDSHLSAEVECAMKGLVAYRLGYRRKSRDSMYRLGIIGHAIMEARLTGKWSESRPRMLLDLADRLHERNGWVELSETYAAADHAAYGAGLILDRLFSRARSGASTMKIAEDEHCPMIERKFEAPIGHILDALDIRDWRADILRKHCTGAQAKVDATFEGRTLNQRDVEIGDWKFKTDRLRVDDFAFPAEILATLPDPQLSWYALVMHCAGWDVKYAAQIQVHAERPQEPLAAADLPRRGDGLPSLKHQTTTADEFLEALFTSTVRVGTGKNMKAIAIRRIEDLDGRIRDAEKFHQHVADLRAADHARAAGGDEASKVLVRGQYIERSSAWSLCRDRLERLAYNLRFSLASRTLRVYPGSPCVKRFGCLAREVCHDSITSSIDDAIEAAVAHAEYVNVYEEKRAGEQRAT